MLKPLQRNTNIILLSGDKDSSLIILDKVSEKEEFNKLINDGISNGVHIVEENGNRLAELKFYQSFIYRNFCYCKGT